MNRIIKKIKKPVSHKNVDSYNEWKNGNSVYAAYNSRKYYQKIIPRIKNEMLDYKTAIVDNIELLFPLVGALTILSVLIIIIFD